MATTQRRVRVLVGLSLGAGVLYLLGPVVGCWYNEYRFNRYVHVQVDVPSCAWSCQRPSRDHVASLSPSTASCSPRLFGLRGAVFSL